MAAYFPPIVCSDWVWKWNCVSVKGMPLSNNIPPTCGTAMTVCPLFCRVNDVSFRNSANRVSFGSTTARTMLTGDCRANGPVPHAGFVSTQKPGPLSPEYEKVASEAIGTWAMQGIPQANHDTGTTNSRQILGFILFFFILHKMALRTGRSGFFMSFIPGDVSTDLEAKHDPGAAAAVPTVAYANVSDDSAKSLSRVHAIGSAAPEGGDHMLWQHPVQRELQNWVDAPGPWSRSPENSRAHRFKPLCQPPRTTR